MVKEHCEIKIDPEEWLRVLQAVTADEEQKERLLAGISQRTGVSLEKV